MTNESVEVSVCRPLNVKTFTADVIDSLIVDHECAVAVLQGGVGAQSRVVGLHNCGGNLGCRVDAEFQLGLLAIVDG